MTPLFFLRVDKLVGTPQIFESLYVAASCQLPIVTRLFNGAMQSWHQGIQGHGFDTGKQGRRESRWYYVLHSLAQSKSKSTGSDLLVFPMVDV